MLRKIDIQLPGDPASYTRRMETSFSPLREPRNSQKISLRLALLENLWCQQVVLCCVVLCCFVLLHTAKLILRMAAQELTALHLFHMYIYIYIYICLYVSVCMCVCVCGVSECVCECECKCVSVSQ